MGILLDDFKLVFVKHFSPDINLNDRLFIAVTICDVIVTLLHKSISLHNGWHGEENSTSL